MSKRLSDSIYAETGYSMSAEEYEDELSYRKSRHFDGDEYTAWVGCYVIDLIWHLSIPDDAETTPAFNIVVHELISRDLGGC